MIIKRYLVSNMNEAMTRIRYDLGKDAVIISQRKIRKPGLAGFFSKKIIEVTAAVENVKKEDDTSIQNSLEAIRKLVDNDKVITEKKEPEKEPERKQQVENKNRIQEVAPAGVSEDLIKEMQEMKTMLNNMTKTPAQRTARKSKIQTELEDNDLNEKTVKKVLTAIKNNEEAIDEKSKVRAAVEKMISLSKPKMEGVIVLVGPTGVGKTTTIAKLAGRLALLEKKKVGLITIDTYRIGAVEQLRTYAEIMNLPFKVVLTTKEMEEAIQSMADCDAILVDTTGRSSKNAMQISELRSFVEKANTKNIHLVISCTTKNKDIDAIVGGFKELSYNNVIITKLDETSTYGSILNILDCAKKPLSFITTGQNVPDDIRQLTTTEVCNLILGDDSVC